MNIVIACNKECLKKSKDGINIVSLLSNSQKDIRVIETYKTIDETFPHKLAYDLNPHKVVIEHKVELKKRKHYTLDIKNIISDILEENNERKENEVIEIVYVFGFLPKTEENKEFIRWLIDNGVYSLLRGKVVGKGLVDLVCNGMTKEQAENFYADFCGNGENENKEVELYKPIESVDDIVNLAQEREEEAVKNDELLNNILNNKSDDAANDISEEPKPQDTVLKAWLKSKEQNTVENDIETMENDLSEEIAMKEEFDKIYSEGDNYIDEDVLLTEEPQSVDVDELPFEDEYVTEKVNVESKNIEIETEDDNIDESLIDVSEQITVMSDIGEEEQEQRLLEQEFMHLGEIEFENALNSDVSEKYISCSVCGKRLSIGSKFCNECGSKVEEEIVEDKVVPVDNNEELRHIFENEMLNNEETTSELEVEEIGVDKDIIEETDYTSTLDEEIFDNSDDDMGEAELLSTGKSGGVKKAKADFSDITTISNDFSDVSVVEGKPKEKQAKNEEVNFVDIDEYSSESDLHTWERRVVEKEKEIIGNVTVGVSQLIARSGCTHISIEMAQMLHNDGYDVGIVITDKKTLKNLKDYFEIKDETQSGFEYEGVKYYGNASLYLAQSEHQIIIADFGLLDDSKKREFERSQVKIMVCDGAEWNINVMEDYILNGSIPYKRNIRYFVNLCGKEKFKAQFKSIIDEGYKTLRISTSEDCFEPCKDNQEAYYNALDSIINNKNITVRRKGIKGLFGLAKR